MKNTAMDGKLKYFNKPCFRTCINKFIKHLLVVLSVSVLSSNAKAQVMLELANRGSGSTTNAVGITTNAQTGTFVANTTGTTFTGYTPATTATFTLTNQQFTSLYLPGMMFGATAGGTNNNNIVSNNVWRTMNSFGSPLDAYFTSNIANTAGTGLSGSANYGIQLETDLRYGYILYGNTNYTARMYYGDLVITFNRPVSNPIIHVGGVGGDQFTNSGLYSQGFYNEFELSSSDISSGITLTELSGNTYFDATTSNTKIVNSNTANPSPYSGTWFASSSAGDGHGSAGSVRVNTGSNAITSLTLKVFLRSNGLNYDATKGTRIVAKEHWAPAEDTGGHVGDGSVLSLSLATYTISGTVFLDGNGLTDNTVNGTATRYAGGTNQLYVSLVDRNNNVFASTPVSSTGTYSFTNVVSSANYSLVLSTVNSATSPSLPATWVNTGENIGTAAGNDGSPNGILPIAILNSAVTNANFGIAVGPTAGSGTQNAGTNPGGTTQVTVNASTFTNTTPSSAVSPATVTGIRITSFPAQIVSIVVNGTAYTSSTFPAAGIIIPTDVNGNPTQSISIDPNFPGGQTVTIPFKARNSNGIESANTGSAVIQFYNTITGNVFNDINGVTDNTINGIGVNPGGLNVVLTSSTSGLVVAVAPVSSTGTYSFTNITNDIYTMVITTNPATVGGGTPARALPAGWVFTGEVFNGLAGHDLRPDGYLPLGYISENISNNNFGIEQIPTAGNGSQTINPNPGGTTQVTVNASAFTNVTASNDPAPGAVTAIRITAFPNNTTSIVINGTSYTSATFPGGGVIVPTDAIGNPTQVITIDPSFAGSGTITIPFVARDVILRESANTGTATLNFFNTVSGNVYNDINGLLDNTVSGSGTNAGGLNAVLVNTTTNLVAATTAVSSTGIFSLTNVTDGSYAVRITTASTTIGAAPPAITLPSGWLNTGEIFGTGTGSDGTVDGIISVGALSGSVNNANFGIEERPTAGGGTQNAGTNPGGATQVTVNASAFTNTTVSSDPAPGAVTAIRITSFPTNTTSIVINGTSYTNATFPVTGVIIPADASGNPTQSISVDPSITGSGNVVISFVARDAAGAESLNTGTATISFTIAILGNVFNDINGLTDNTVNGTGTNAGGLNAVLTNTTSNIVVAVTTVSSTGTFSFTGINNGNYSTRITTNPATVGSTPPAVVLPAGWVNTGENAGTGAGSDGFVDGIISLRGVTSTASNLNFGIEERPTAGSGTQNAGTNPGSTTQVTVNASAFTNTTVSSDPAPGAVIAIRITAFPTNTTSIVINGTSYTNATFPVAGVIVPADVSGNPAQSVTIDPSITGSGNVVISFVARDAAGVESLNTGTATISFTIAISGNVFNDINGLTDNTVNGTGTNAGGLNAVLTNTTSNIVVAVTTVSSTGTFSFTGINNGNYSTRITTNPATVGSTPPAVVLPAGWVNTGENAGTGAGSDGFVDGIISLRGVTSTASNLNFGIEERPTAGSGTQNAGTNPGSTTQVTVNASAFTNTTVSSDPAPGAVTAIRITAFPTNTTSIVINGTSYTSATFPVTGVIVPADASGNPTQPVTIDPSITGSGTVVISFVARDAANVESLNTGTATISFTIAISGNVFFDTNGLTDNTVNGTGTNAGGALKVILIDNTSTKVSGVTNVNADGTYNFSGLPNSIYSILVTTNTAAVGGTPPSVALPLGWINTGENIGSGSGSDGTIDGRVILSLVQSPLSNVNFGIANCFANSTSSPSATATAASGVYCAQSATAPIQLNSSATGGVTPYTYAWVGNGLSNNAIQNPIVTPTVSSSYAVTITDAIGCKGTASTNIIYDNTAPSISWSCGTDPSWVRLMENNGASWNWTTTSGGRFYTSSAYSTGDDNTTSNLRMPYIKKAGNYNVQITSANGCISTGSITMSPTPASCNIVLPDENIDLYATWAGNNVLVKWNTAITNVTAFTVQRSIDGINFIYAGEVKAGQSTTYSYTDILLPATCTNLWYRVKAKDVHGKEVMSKATMLTCKQIQEGTILVTPNPVTNGQFTLLYKIPVEGTVHYDLYDMHGKRITTGKLDNTSANEQGSKVITLPTGVQQGLYFIKLYKEQWISKPVKIIVTRQ